VRRVLDSLVDGTISADMSNIFSELYQSLLFGDNNIPDPYMVIRDFESYAKTHARMCADYQNMAEWNKKAIINTARSGVFSSDRCIMEYNSKIWKLR